MHIKTFSAALGLGLAAILGGGTPLLAEGLPGGASSLNETHGAWTVTCALPEGKVRCAVTQTLLNRESRQRVLTAELRPVADGAEGILLLPFGLRLDDGVRLGLDGAAPFATLGYSTCLPAGCLAPLTLDAAELAGLLAGTALDVRLVASDTGQEVPLSLPVEGLRSALARAGQLEADGG